MHSYKNQMHHKDFRDLLLQWQAYLIFWFLSLMDLNEQLHQALNIQCEHEGEQMSRDRT